MSRKIHLETRSQAKWFVHQIRGVPFALVAPAFEEKLAHEASEKIAR